MDFRGELGVGFELELLLVEVVVGKVSDRSPSVD
jgi:hypothetical protein